jgi:alpha-beta hydrolase superfamily lysophospholipase
MRILSLPVISLAMTSLASCESDRAPSMPAGSPSSPAERSPSPSAAQRATHVTSKDGTRIAFETAGKGPALIVVSGALSSRALQTDKSLVAELGERFTVYTYDRRGRGESTDTKPYAVAREVEDIEALIAHAGSSAYLFGVSSGAATRSRSSAWPSW